ncbi:DUF3417 domain-containing protein [Chloroflexota bacterium]
MYALRCQIVLELLHINSPLILSYSPIDCPYCSPGIDMTHPKLPERINRLDELANNLWWSWHEEARQLFRPLDYPLWRMSMHNPVNSSTRPVKIHCKQPLTIQLSSLCMTP